jgi:hypothetical protein
MLLLTLQHVLALMPEHPIRTHRAVGHLVRTAIRAEERSFWDVLLHGTQGRQPETIDPRSCPDIGCTIRDLRPVFDQEMQDC